MWGWSLSCWDSQAAFFQAENAPSNGKAYHVGIAFHGLQVKEDYGSSWISVTGCYQVQVYGKNGGVKDQWTNMKYFTRNVSSPDFLVHLSS